MTIITNTFKSKDDLIKEIDKTIKFFKDGDIIQGKVVSIARDEVLLDVGYKTEGVIPAKELSLAHRAKPSEIVEMDEIVEAIVVQKEDKEGRLILSRRRAISEKTWENLAKAKENNEIIEGRVIQVVKDGVLVDVGIKGFLPSSQIESYRVRDLSPYLGQTLELKVLTLEKQKYRDNIVLSHRAVTEATDNEERSEFIATLEKGQIHKGTVASITNFGVFVKIGKIDGLVHVSELSWHHVDHPAEAVEIGQEVTVEVLGVNEDSKTGATRVSLSIKATQQDPWQIFASNHAIGQIVPGKIVKLVTFGAFIKVADGIEGLVHISELSTKHITAAEQVCKVGDNVFAKIVDIDLERRRISLSIKQATELVNPDSDDFDQALYGAAQDYDDNGNYIFPEGFDSEAGEWKDGYEKEKEVWAANYVKARDTWEAHKEFVKSLAEKEANIEVKDEEKPKKTRSRKDASQDTTVGEDVKTVNSLEGNADLEALKESLES